MKIVVATNNKDKLVQFRHFLCDNFELLTLQQVGVYDIVEETGTTLRENAFIKANHAYKKTNLPVVADDSGLCVDAMGGAPGVYSAEYGGGNSPQTLIRNMELTDVERNNLLIQAMKRKNNRACHFACCLCLIMPDKPVIYFEAELHGELLHKPQGNGGFGYDPIVYLPKMRCSNAELPIDKKMQISHRGQAMRKLKEYLL